MQQIQTVEQELKVILNNMRQLSYAIKPNTMEWVPVEELIKGFIEKIAESFPFKIQFYTIGNESSIPREGFVHYADNRTLAEEHREQRWSHNGKAYSNNNQRHRFMLLRS